MTVEQHGPQADARYEDARWDGIRRPYTPEDVERLRELFLRHHADLLEPEFWQAAQRRIESGELMDFFPYPESLRFRNREAAVG